jgi:hypothetical protein
MHLLTHKNIVARGYDIIGENSLPAAQQIL